jgi:hypothetical protein
LKLRVLAFSLDRPQSAEADGARARNRTSFFEYEYEQEIGILLYRTPPRQYQKPNN